ncbi:hypothetical protein C8A05DRAFT_14853, partial [Staphylotrichum tortipilum]
SDEYLPVVEVQHLTWLGRCRDNAPSFRIEVFYGGHVGAVGSNCKPKGHTSRGSNVDLGMNIAGCDGGYTDGWGVCLTEGGARVYEPPRWYQLCEWDDTLLANCPSGLWCWLEVTRKLKCDAIWQKDR